jgi:hypothetical protein
MSEQESDVRLLLDAVDVPAPKIDLGAVVREGQRARRRRRRAEVAGISALAVLVAAAVAVPLALHRPARGTVGLPPARSAAPSVSPSPPAQRLGTCAVARLALPAGMADYRMQAVDPTGRYAVGWANSNVIYATMFWDGGHPQVMRVPGKPMVETVNAHGVVAGVTMTGSANDEHVYRWTGGRTTILKYPMRGGWHPYGVYVNGAGVIAANAEPRGQSGGVGSVVVVWRPGTTTGVRLPIPSGTEIFGITDSGLLVGTQNLSDDATANNRGAVWDLNGKLLRTVPFASYVSLVAQTGDLAAGRPDTDAGYPASAFRWNLRTGEVTPVPNLVDMPVAMNANGWVVDMTGRVVAGDRILQLPGLRAADRIDVPLSGGLADDGTVVGASLAGDKGAVSTPVRWRCS